MSRAAVAFCALALVAAACREPVPLAADPTPSATPFAAETETVLVRFGEATVTVEVVADPPGRQLGLMHRTELGDDAGMLFLFPSPSSGGFWMKNTLIPLQIAYMQWIADGKLEVLALRDMVPCEADPCYREEYDPGVAYDAALEVNAAWFDRHGVRVGSVAGTEGALPQPS